jgi:uncharacterized protein YbaR (Trm112 family)
MSFDFDALEGMLVCPKSKSKLVRDGDSLVSVDPESRLKYEIRDGIPNMFPDDATTLSVEDWSAIMARHGIEPAGDNCNVLDE